MSPPGERVRTLTLPPPPPPPPPPTNLEGKVRDLEEFRRDQHRTNTDMVSYMASMDGTLSEIRDGLKTANDAQKSFTSHRKALDWATRLVLGTALVMLVHWFGKIAMYVQSAKLPP